VTVATVLILYAACVGTLGSRMLGRATWPDRAPLLAIITYLAAAWSVAAALGLAGLTLAIHATALAGGLSSLIGACVPSAAMRSSRRKPLAWSGTASRPSGPSWSTTRSQPPTASRARSRP
jgi:hypothetical protein